MNYHALAPKRYKRSVVSGFVHRIYRACSTWENFHTSLTKAKLILEKNQYPPTFYEPLVRQTLNDILGVHSDQKQDKKQNLNSIDKKTRLSFNTVVNAQKTTPELFTK